MARPTALRKGVANSLTKAIPLLQRAKGHELWSSSLGGGADLYLIQAGGTLNAELNTSWRLPDEFA
jgi:hypothetical protein